MKKLTCIIVASFFIMSSCSDKIEKTRTRKVGGNKFDLVIESGLTYQQYEINEFEFKNHIYIYSRVRDGIAMTHAGHCPCNKK
jgi:hypothetical protein